MGLRVPYPFMMARGAAVAAAGIGTVVLAAALLLVFAARTDACTLAYVANFGDDTITVIDTATSTVLGLPIAVGRSPAHIAITPDGARAYVTNQNGGSISAIDTAVQSVVATIHFDPDLAVSPGSIAITPSGRRAYVTDVSDNNTVWVIDTVTNAVAHRIQVSAPMAIAVAPNGARGYLVSREPDRISVFDTATSELLGTPTLIGADQFRASVSDVALTPDGTRAYVTGDGTVSIMDTRTNAVVGSVAVGGQPLAVALTPNGAHAYVTNLNDGSLSSPGRVSLIDTRTNTLQEEIPVGHAPAGVAITPDGADAYVSNLNDGTVSIIDIRRAAVRTTLSVGARPLGIAMAPGRHCAFRRLGK